MILEDGEIELRISDGGECKCKCSETLELHASYIKNTSFVNAKSKKFTTCLCFLGLVLYYHFALCFMISLSHNARKAYIFDPAILLPFKYTKCCPQSTNT